MAKRQRVTAIVYLQFTLDNADGSDLDRDTAEDRAYRTMLEASDWFDSLPKTTVLGGDMRLTWEGDILQVDPIEG